MADRCEAAVHTNIDFNTAGRHPLQPGQLGTDVMILELSLMAAGANVVSLESDSGVNLMGPYPLLANGGIALGESNIGKHRTVSGEGLEIVLTANTRVTGHVVTRRVPDHFEF